MATAPITTEILQRRKVFKCGHILFQAFLNQYIYLEKSVLFMNQEPIMKEPETSAILLDCS